MGGYLVPYVVIAGEYPCLEDLAPKGSRSVSGYHSDT